MATPHAPRSDIADWLVTYGDTMTLVVTFFVLLVAIGQVQGEERLQEMLAALRGQFGGSPPPALAATGVRPRSTELARALNAGRARRAAALRRETATGEMGNSPAGRATARTHALDMPIAVLDFSTNATEPTSSQVNELQQSLARHDDDVSRMIELHGTPPANSSDPRDIDRAFTCCRACAAALLAQGVNPVRIRIVVTQEPPRDEANRDGEQAAQGIRVKLYLRGA